MPVAHYYFVRGCGRFIDQFVFLISYMQIMRYFIRLYEPIN